MSKQAQKLRSLLDTNSIIRMPCAWDSLSARLISQAGFPLTLMSGFAVSGAKLAMPDTGLISFAEMVDQLRLMCQAAPDLLVIGDGDTGYGNALNAQRTVSEYARAGAAAIMIEDQVSPKRCGHTKGKQVVSTGEARMRIRAAVDAAHEGDTDILIMARTDARAVHGFDDAMERCRIFAEEGADILFLEAPESIEEMRSFCAAFDKPAMANMVGGGKTPILPAEELEKIGYRIAAYPLVAFSAAIAATRAALEALKTSSAEKVPQVTFDELKTLVGFDDYYAREQAYRAE
ncbi:MAG: isocitrate lyase/PEP mutase family protein [Proteobacteria bacterium]|nr:isocitrate lyase/PEP mutase family protein [Pseudomonadota bacterium]